jgi:pimeloyl-ACP methyl ester carboxylesterase
MPLARLGGTPIYFETRGASGPRVLLIQGVGCIGATWGPQIEGLGQTHQLAWFDNRGIGGSVPVPAGPLSIEQMAGDALALLDHLGWESAHLVGHSMGGVIAQQAALQAPQRVRSLVLACTLYRGRDVLRLQRKALWLMLRGQLGTAAMRRQAFCDLVFPRAFVDRVGRAGFLTTLQALYGRDLAAPPPISRRQLAALRRHDVAARLGEISQPTLVVKGGVDLVIDPRQSDELAARIRHAALHTFADAGHGLPIQYAEEFNACVREHIARVPKGGG